MIGWYRTAKIAPGKIPSSIAFAKEIAAFVKSKTGVEVRVAMPMAGNPSRIGWSAQYESLAALEKAQASFVTDSKYMEMVVKSSDNFIAGSLHDEIWRIL